MNEPFFHGSGYKTNKAINLVIKLLKDQVNDLIRVKIVINLNFRNEKVIFIVFYAKNLSRLLP